MSTEDKYTLRKLADLLNVSTGMIYKIETMFVIRDWSSKISGKKSYYSPEKLRFFSKVIFLSKLGVRLVDIKPLFKIEEKIYNFIMKHFPVPQMKVDEIKRSILDKTIDEKLKTGIANLFLIDELYGGEDSIEYDRLKFEKDTVNAKKLERLFRRHDKMIKKMSETAYNMQCAISGNIDSLNRPTSKKP